MNRRKSERERMSGKERERERAREREREGGESGGRTSWHFTTLQVCLPPVAVYQWYHL